MTRVADDNYCFQLGKSGVEGRAADTPNGTGINALRVTSVPQPTTAGEGTQEARQHRRQ